MFDHITYFRTLATKCKDVQHVESDESKRHYLTVSSLANLDQLLQCINSARFPAVIVEDMLTGRHLDNGSWNLLDMPVYSFIIIKPAAIANDAGRRQCIADCAAIANKFFSRMYRDKQSDQRGNAPKTGLADFDRGSVTWQDVGPLGDNCYGRMYSFTMLHPMAADCKYNTNHWLP